MKFNKIEVLQKTQLFGGLDEDVLRRLAKKAAEKTLEHDEILFIAGETAAGLYVIAEGSVRAFRTGLDGREQVIHVERAITTIAEVPVFDDGTYPSTAAAEEQTKLYFLHKSDIRAACFEYPQLALAAARLLAGRLRRCAELVETLSLREVGQRLAKLFLEEAVTHGINTPSGLCFRLSLTHNQLAARIGTVREVVTRAIQRLNAQELLIVNGRSVTIPNPDALRAYASAE